MEERAEGKGKESRSSFVRILALQKEAVPLENRICKSTSPCLPFMLSCWKYFNVERSELHLVNSIFHLKLLEELVGVSLVSSKCLAGISIHLSYVCWQL